MAKGKSTGKKIALAVLAVVLVFLALAGLKALQIVTMIKQDQTMPPETVTSAEIASQTWQPVISTVGSISAVQGVMIRAELGGRVQEIAFESGQEVEKGALLVQLDVTSEEAALRAGQADAQLAREELDRARSLRERKVISASELDSALAKADSAGAQVQNLQSAIAKKTITAPFAGRLGIRQVNLGQVLDAGAEIVSLQTVKQVYADFGVPQQRMTELETGLPVKVTTDAFPDRVFDGELTALNSSLDVDTRSLSLQATLENPDGLLRPGMFGRIEVVLPERKNVLVVPATAIAYAPYGDSIYLIENRKNEKSGADELILRQQFVRLGETRGDFVEIVKGAEAGLEVVSTGLFKLRNGMSVTIDNTLAPEPSLNPTPPET